MSAPLWRRRLRVKLRRFFNARRRRDYEPLELSALLKPPASPFTIGGAPAVVFLEPNSPATPRAPRRGRKA